VADPSPGRDSFKLEGVRVKGCLGAIMPEELKRRHCNLTIGVSIEDFSLLSATPRPTIVDTDADSLNVC